MINGTVRGGALSRFHSDARTIEVYIIFASA